MELLLRPELLSVCRLAADAPWPRPPDDGSLFSSTSSGAPTSASSAGAERSLVCRQDLAPSGASTEPGWRAMTVAGPLDFDLVGVLADLTTPLARAGVSVFVLSTFDTDHVLVRDEDVDRAVDALGAAGHIVSRA